MSHQELEAEIVKHLGRHSWTIVMDDIDPTIAPFGNHARSSEGFMRRHDVNPLNSESVTRAEHRRAVVWIMRVIEKDSDGVHPVDQSFAKASAALRCG